MRFEFNLKDKVEDNITGYTGIVMARTEYTTGCNHYGILQDKLDKDGNLKEWTWFDEARLVLVSSGVKRTTPPRGGPAQHAPEM